MDFLPSVLLKKADGDHCDRVLIVESNFSIDTLAFNKKPKKSSAALNNQMPIGMKFSVMKSIETKNKSMLLSKSTTLKISSMSTLFVMIES